MPYGLEIKDLIIFGAGGIVALIVAYVFYRKGVQKKQITYSVRARTLVYRSRDYPDGLKITFNGRDLQRLTRISVFIWNSGNQPITKNDLLTRSPLTIELPQGGFEVLQSSVGQQSRIANNVVLEGGKLTFDYLNPRDGAVIDIFGNQTNRGLELAGGKDVRVEGEIIGATGRTKKRAFSFGSSRIFNGLLIASGLMFIAFGVIFVFLDADSFNIPQTLEQRVAAARNWPQYLGYLVCFCLYLESYRCSAATKFLPTYSLRKTILFARHCAN